jgi:threonylcarbamoyladenosine tRNA methylthiotransferase MtaB
MPLRVAFHTHGCKLNQLETDALADAFSSAGAELLSFGPEGAGGGSPAPDLAIVNSCTVTAKAEAKARRSVRLALAKGRDTLVLVTGCYAELEAAALSSLGERVLVLPGSRKEAMLGLPAFLASRGPPLEGALREWLGSRAAAPRTDRFAFDPRSFAYHSRPALKIQDGCDNECAYCRVVLARGPSSSLAADEVLARARALEAAGRAEIVLTGVNVSQYRDGELDFPGLLRRLLSGTDSIAYRVSSYEPDRVDEAFLEAFSDPRIRPHLHLAAQSGADSLLRAMGRRYDRSALLAAVEALRRVKGDPFLAADFIAGLPGETEADAAATIRLAEACDFAWIHAFRFSPRPGTAAERMPAQVPERLRAQRAEALFRLGRRGKAAYLDRWSGREVPAVLEGIDAGRQTRNSAILDATTENYLKVRVRGLGEENRPGLPIVCRIEEVATTAESAGIDAFALYIGEAPEWRS